MKRIYIVLTYTGTLLSRIIKGYTGAEFSHVSIALDEELDQMYSFGRLKPYNPLIGGFVQEYIDKGTFKRFKNTSAKVYSMEVENNQYEKIKETINKIQNSKKRYKFNIIGLFAAGFNLKISGKDSFYCAEFVKHVLESAGLQTNLPEVVKPESFKELKELNLIYSGRLKNYKLARSKIAEALENLLLHTKKEGVV